jgi:hypothetical protein
MVEVILIMENKTMEVGIDMDSDLISKEPIDEKLSERIVSMEDENRVFYVTDMFDLFSQYENIQIAKRTI